MNQEEIIGPWKYLDGLRYQPREIAKMITEASSNSSQFIVLSYLSERATPLLREQVKKCLDNDTLFELFLSYSD